jgi:hypothetical protein
VSASLSRLVLSLLVAGIVVITCVLPAEYGVDVTGAGRVLGLTPMGEFKRAVAEEEATNRRAQAEADSLAGLSR